MRGVVCSKRNLSPDRSIRSESTLLRSLGIPVPVQRASCSIGLCWLSCRYCQGCQAADIRLTSCCSFLSELTIPQVVAYGLLGSCPGFISEALPREAMSSVAGPVFDDVIDLVSDCSDCEEDHQEEDHAVSVKGSPDGCLASVLSGSQLRGRQSAGSRSLRSEDGQGAVQKIRSASSGTAPALADGGSSSSAFQSVGTSSCTVSLGQKRARADSEQSTASPIDVADGSEPPAGSKRRRTSESMKGSGSSGHGCEVCGKVLSSARALRQHVSLVHLGERYHECTVCGKCFSRAGDLKTHMITVHLGERNHECSVCGKRFGQSCSLKTHMRTVHLGERKHECTVCGKRFGEAGHLKTHMSTVHLGERNHECSVCGKRFGGAGHLKTHMSAVHLGVRNHECSVCGKRFSQAGHLKRHISSVHR